MLTFTVSVTSEKLAADRNAFRKLFGRSLQSICNRKNRVGNQMVSVVPEQDQNAKGWFVNP